MAHHAWTAALYACASGASPASLMRTSTSSASSGAPMSPSAASKDVYVLTVGRCPSARRFSNSHQTSSGSGDSPRPLRLRRMVESFCVAMCTGKQLLPLAHFLHAYGDAPSPSADPVPSIEIGPDDEALDDVAPADVPLHRRVLRCGIHRRGACLHVRLRGHGIDSRRRSRPRVASHRAHTTDASEWPSRARTVSSGRDLVRPKILVGFNNICASERQTPP